MKFNSPTVFPEVKRDILILLNDGKIHEGEFIILYDPIYPSEEDAKIDRRYHIYKDRKWLKPIDVQGWIYTSRVNPSWVYSVDPKHEEDEDGKQD